MKQLIFGLGTGRCGTVSLKELLGLQNDFTSTHELVITPWQFSKGHIDKTIAYMQNRPWGFSSCDVSFWHLPYVIYILDKFPNSKFICLKRTKKDTVASYIKKTAANTKTGLKERNHWTARDSIYWDSNLWRLDPIYDNCYPKYNLPKIDAIEQYWDDYYNLAAEYAAAFKDNFMLFNTEEVLNDETTQSKLLTFLNIPLSNRVINTQINENKGA
ncbi:MAG TPA: hypothetical protein VI911_07730 [Patescibacteria group bacterium]|nr:hypothetical protein [Patescibacteria group bacterium]